MTREILFKAKRKDGGKWVDGYYEKRFDVDCSEQHFIFWSKSCTVWEYAEIDLSTLCQYTGLTDKNGQKIWENDIISISAYSYYEPEDDYFGVVTYCEKDVCWCLKNREESSEEVICECFGSYTTEIINHGNIFDNEDLLEV